VTDQVDISFMASRSSTAICLAVAGHALPFVRAASALDVVTLVAQYRGLFVVVSALRCGAETMLMMSVSHALALLIVTTVTQVSGAPNTAAEPRAQATASAPAAPKVLFLCPHGAAKSVLASAYFTRLAKERGLNVRVDAAGTEPDPVVASAVSNHLTGRGYAVPVSKPKRVTRQEFEQADLVISLGCDLKDLPTPRGTLRRWDDVPAPSQDFTGADQAIYAKVVALVEELVRNGGKVGKD
jgi:arsenate reductase